MDLLVKAESQKNILEHSDYFEETYSGAKDQRLCRHQSHTKGSIMFI